MEAALSSETLVTNNYTTGRNTQKTIGLFADMLKEVTNGGSIGVIP
jgi:hypothetical protein